MHQHQITESDTGYACGFLIDTGPVLPRLAPSMQRALETRVMFLEAEQAARAWEIEKLYQRSEVLTYELLEDQQQLRQFREILEMRGCA